MEQERQKLIVKEIQHWQRSRLLPDKYCDFLLNLYFDGSADRPPSGLKDKAVSALQQSKGRHWFLVFGLVSLICFIVFYFNFFHPILQIAVLTTGIIVLLLLGHRFRRRNEASGLVFIGMGMVTLLGSGIYMMQLHGMTEWIWKALFFGFCSIVWAVYGISARIALLHFCGWAAAIMVYALLLSRYSKEPDWYDIQLYWVPASFLFAWGSWFVRRWSKSVSAVVFVTASLLWFMPEIYTVLLAEIPEWFQLQILLKIAIGGVMLYTLRKRWIAWVA